MAYKVSRELDNSSNLSVITCAAALAHLGLLESKREMGLVKFDLTSVPEEDLASLVSNVTEHFSILNVSGCDLVSLLDSVKSKMLSVKKQSLGSEETLALVRAMESHVERVCLYEEVTLDISSLMRYIGQGECRRVDSYWDTATRYSAELRTWASSKAWTVTSGGPSCTVKFTSIIFNT